MSRLKLDRLATRSGNNVIDINKLASLAGRYVRQTQYAVESATYNFTTAWALGPSFNPFNGVQLKAGSVVKLYYHMPFRNDALSWAGTYTELQYRINGGTWVSMGSTGYDGGTMHYAGGTGVTGAGHIAFYNNTLIIDPQQTADFTIDFRFYCRSYGGTSILNGSHEINVISGTAALQPSPHGNQHFSHVIAEELATLA